MIKINRDINNPENDTRIYREILEYLYNISIPKDHTGRIIPFHLAVQYSELNSPDWEFYAWNRSFRINTHDKVHETYLAIKYGNQYQI